MAYALRNQIKLCTLGKRLLLLIGLLLSVSLTSCSNTPVTGAPMTGATTTTPTTPPTATGTGASPTATPQPSCTPTSTPTLSPPASSSTPIPPSGWSTFTDTVYHYSIQYPANWIVPFGSCSGRAFDVYNYDPRQGVGGPQVPPGSIAIEVLPSPNPSQLSAADFYTQLQQQQQQEPGGPPPCPAETTHAKQVGGRDALEVNCPAQNNDEFYVLDGLTMLLVGASGGEVNGQPATVFMQMVASMTFTN
jgi:hypothetical protein